MIIHQLRQNEFSPTVYPFYAELCMLLGAFRMLEEMSCRAFYLW
jgi:hypothetical protein